MVDRWKRGYALVPADEFVDGSGAAVLNGMADAIAPWAVRVAATLRLADRLKGGPRSAAALAAESGADEDALRRLLRYLACRGVFAERAPGEFALNDAAEPLLGDHPMGLRIWLDLDGLGGRFDAVYATGLLETVRTGRASYASVHGRPFWDDLEALGKTELFDRMMGSDAAMWVPEVATEYDWGSVRRVTDVGGGNGTLLKGLLDAHSHLRGTLVDLPGTVENARATLAGLAERVSFAPGSFFDTLPAGSDVYVLAHVLHDWDDSDAQQILSRCAAAAEPQGRVLVVDRTGTSEDDLLEFTEMDVQMMVLFGAKERTEAEFADLASSAGLVLRSATSLGAGLAMLEFVPR
ncbi:methyltransferase, partial [Saccharomonospora sp. NB11]|uniref:methyltransferase n=1 Tax=Saccharomonospora sp. NB11 TaxID=1642298 RepID=UPI0018D03C25